MNDKTGKSVTMDSLSEPTVSNVGERGKRNQNWRLEILSKPRVQNAKYVEPPYSFSSGVRPEALKAPLRERDVQMGIPTLRRLYVNKHANSENANIRKDFNKIMDKHIEHAWNSIYNEYKKAKKQRRLKRLAKLAEKRKAKKQKQQAKAKKDGSGDPEKERQEWIEKSAKPKPAVEPAKIDRGPRVDLDAIKEHIDVMSVPLYPTEKYVTPPPPKHIVHEAALTYEASERVIELAKPLASRLIKEEEIIPGGVKPGALLHKTTEKDTALAAPRARASANDSDLKEDPFSISKNALKYKATPRIIELAKPRQVK